MYTEEQFINLEQEERKVTDESIAIMQLIMLNTKGDLEKNLREFYSKYGKDGVVTYAEAQKWVSEKNRTRRLTELTLVIGGLFVASLYDLKSHFTRFLTDIVSKEALFFGVTLNVDKILTSKWGVDELYWLQRLEADVDLWKVYIANDIKRAMLQGKSLDAVLSQVDKRFKSISYILETLGLSESTAVGSLSRQAIFKELGVGKYQFYTKADERTCETCGAMHGLVFPVAAYDVGVTASPLHPRCRCWEVPIWE